MIVDTPETRYVTNNVLDNLKFISIITVFDLSTNNKTQLSKICPYMHRPCFYFMYGTVLLLCSIFL